MSIAGQTPKASGFLMLFKIDTVWYFPLTICLTDELKQGPNCDNIII